MLNENRFLGTFRGHNTRTILRDAVNPKIREYMVGCLQLASVAGYKSKSVEVFSVMLIDLILVRDHSAFSVFVQRLVCTEFVYMYNSI